MSDTTRISGVAYDRRTGFYHGAVTFSGAGGTIRLRVSAPGCPDWTYARILSALEAAAAVARAARPDVAL